MSDATDTQSNPLPSNPPPTNPLPTPAKTKNPNKRVSDSHRGDNSWKAYSNQWKANHGTQLMAFAGLVFLVGAGYLFYQQNKFQPPMFPEGDSIDSVREQLIDVESGGVTPEGALGLSETGAEKVASQFVMLRVLGASDKKGKIRVAVYDSGESFNQVEKAIWKRAWPVKTEGHLTLEIPLDDQPEEFAIAVFQDVNDNGKLDRNKLGIPAERYGFSRGARGKLGPPAFSEAVIPRPQPGQLIELEIW
ncbi:DUF2141 domain-containing protein [Neorhodopirellula lusitana]|uniref:DUF2141 domain-containing protein n=1 Tax=Neorhodopirellula lusitana TaxID=445327 RepID=UPI00384FE0E8